MAIWFFSVKLKSPAAFRSVLLPFVMPHQYGLRAFAEVYIGGAAVEHAVRSVFAAQFGPERLSFAVRVFAHFFVFFRVHSIPSFLALSMKSETSGLSPNWSVDGRSVSANLK
jgi:hypothetical protein